MLHICVLLIIVCLIEFVIIFWMRNAKVRNKNIENTIEFFRSLWGKFTFYVLATSIIGLFLGSVYFKKEIELETINSWVSIVLGLVALIIGIISLFLSFYNVDQSKDTQKESIDIMRNMESEFNDKFHNLQNVLGNKIDESSRETRELFGKFTNKDKVSINQPSGENSWGKISGDENEEN